MTTSLLGNIPYRKIVVAIYLFHSLFFFFFLIKQDSFSLDNIIKSLDKNNDGSISFDEFVMLIKKITGTGQ